MISTIPGHAIMCFSIRPRGHGIIPLTISPHVHWSCSLFLLSRFVLHCHHICPIYGRTPTFVILWPTISSPLILAHSHQPRSLRTTWLLVISWKLALAQLDDQLWTIGPIIFWLVAMRPGHGLVKWSLGSWLTVSDRWPGYLLASSAIIRPTAIDNWPGYLMAKFNFGSALSGDLLELG